VKELSVYLGLGRGLAMKHFNALADSFENSLTEAARELADMGLPEICSIRERILQRCGFHKLHQ
jgi:hypothetical protein